MGEMELMVRNPAEQASPGRAAGDVEWISHIEEHSSWPILAKLPAIVTAEISMKLFCVKDVLGLRKGQVFETGLSEAEDVPLMVGKVQVAWIEFEVVDHRLVARLTRLA